MSFVHLKNKFYPSKSVGDFSTSHLNVEAIGLVLNSYFAALKMCSQNQKCVAGTTVISPFFFFFHSSRCVSGRTSSTAFSRTHRQF